MKKIHNRLLQIMLVILSKIKNEELLEIAAVALVYMIMEVIGITCPILFLTGISCAGCGMTRAWLSLLRFDLPAAFHYHPLFWFPALMVFVFLLKKRVKIWCLTGVILFLVVYGVRMFSDQDEIVVFRPTGGFLYRIFVELFQILKQRNFLKLF